MQKDVEYKLTILMQSKKSNSSTNINIVYQVKTGKMEQMVVSANVKTPSPILRLQQPLATF